jgi:hypothetical protein
MDMEKMVNKNSIVKTVRNGVDWRHHHDTQTKDEKKLLELIMNVPV